MEVVKAVRDMAEVKHLTTTGVLEINTLGFLSHVSGVGAGSNSNSRIGSKLRPLSLTMKLCVQNDNTGIAGSSCFRLMIVRARVNAALALADMPNLLDTANYAKYFVLYDKFMTITGPAGGGPQVLSRKIFIKAKRFLEIQYDGASSTVGNNLIYVYFVGDHAVTDGRAPDADWSTLLSFNDL